MDAIFNRQNQVQDITLSSFHLLTGTETMPELIKLDMVDLALAVGLMAIAIGISAWEQLGLELNLSVATGRTILQLLIL